MKIYLLAIIEFNQHRDKEIQQHVLPQYLER